MIVGTIFSFGEHGMVMSALNAVAMIFNSPTFNGGSLILLSFLIALLFMVLPTMAGEKPNIKAMLIIFFLYFGGIQQKGSITVQDYYTGQISTVANIPLIVGVPASLASKISYELGNLIESTMTTPTTSKTFRDGGFANPLKLIYSLRPGNVKSANPNWSNSFENFIRDCAQYSPAWDAKKAISTPILTNYMLATDGSFPVAGLTVFYVDGGPVTGTTYTCDTAQSALAAATVLTSGNPVVNASGLQSFIQKSFSDRPIPIAPGTELSNLTDALNDVTGGLTSAQQDAQSFIVNAIAMQPLSNAIKCNTSASLMTSTCIANAGVFSAMDQARLDQAAGASTFAKTAVPMMNIMMILFYLFSPILLIVAMMMPSKTLAIMAGYIMFAVWTQSFLPTAMAINYIIEMQTSDALGQMVSGGVNMTNAYSFYEVLATKIGLASELFAMTPMLSMALLSGSIMGLTQLAGAMNQKDHFDEKAMSPDAMSNGAVAKNGNVLTADGGMLLHNTSSKIGGAHVLEAIGGNGAIHEKLSHSAAGTASVQHAESIASSAVTKEAEAKSIALGKTQQSSYSQSDYEGIGSSIVASNSDSSKAIVAIGNDVQQATKIGNSEKTKLDGLIAMKTEQGVNFFGLASAKMSEQISAATGVEKTKADEMVVALKRTEGVEGAHINDFKHSSDAKGGQDLKHDVSVARSKVQQQNYQRAKEASRNAQKQVVQARAYAATHQSSAEETTDVTADRIAGSSTEAYRLLVEQELMNQASKPKDQGGAGIAGFDTAVNKKLAAMDRAGLVRGNRGARLSAILDVLAESGENGLAVAGNVFMNTAGVTEGNSPQFTQTENHAYTNRMTGGNNTSTNVLTETAGVPKAVEGSRTIKAPRTYNEKTHKQRVAGAQAELVSNVRYGIKKAIVADAPPLNSAANLLAQNKHREHTVNAEAIHDNQSIVKLATKSAVAPLVGGFDSLFQAVGGRAPMTPEQKAEAKELVADSLPGPGQGGLNNTFNQDTAPNPTKGATQSTNNKHTGHARPTDKHDNKLVDITQEKRKDK